jgi:hypothetical protein
MCINKIFCQIMKKSVKRQSFKRHGKCILTNKTNSAIKEAWKFICYFYNMISNPIAAPKNRKWEELHTIIYPIVSIVILETTCLGMFHVRWQPFPFHCWLQRTIPDLKFPGPSLYVLIYTVWISMASYFLSRHFYQNNETI